MLWRREKSLPYVNKVELLTVHSIQCPRYCQKCADKVCPVSICISWCNVLPRQSVEASNVVFHELITYLVGDAVFSSVVVDREQYRHNDNHQRHEYDDHGPHQSDEEVPIKPALDLEFLILDVEDPADPLEWVRRYSFYPQSVLYEIRLWLAVWPLTRVSRDNENCKVLTISYALQPSS